MNYNKKNETVVFNEHYKIIKAEVSYDTFDGNIISTNRLAFDRGNSVAILLVDIETNSIVLTKQFRYPTTFNNNDWILEIPAGSLEKDECPLQCIIRETEEEVGYNIEKPKQIASFYTSPGGSTEKLTLFFSNVRDHNKVSKGGGVTTENEDIKIIKIPITEIDNWLENKIIDAKTMIALQWYKINYL